MARRNPHFDQLTPNYLFPRIEQRRRQLIEANPSIELISLGIGDTTQPITESVVRALVEASRRQGLLEGYQGYGPSEGIEPLRQAVAAFYRGRVHSTEIFISDGAKCDLGRLQQLFGAQCRVAVQDPAYPVYVDGSWLAGVEELVPMPCTAQNGFFPDLERLAPVDLIYFCSPNNPTGAVATRKQLEQLVDFARSHHAIIIYDAAYANYIQDPQLPRSIYEIEGARSVAIEVGSFSKRAGFTGLRLGWSVVPEELCYDDGRPVQPDWRRLICTLFNGASSVVQAAGIAACSPEGLEESASLTRFYLENASLLKQRLTQLGYRVFGASHAPYLWLDLEAEPSWHAFDRFLERFGILTAPGVGFGPSGEGFLRLTAFGQRHDLLRALARLEP